MSNPCHICGKAFPHPHDWFCSAAWAPVGIRRRLGIGWEFLDAESNWVPINDELFDEITDKSNPSGYVLHEAV